MRPRILLTVLPVFIGVCCSSSWAQVLLIHTPGQRFPAEPQLERACQFYGLNIERIGLSNDDHSFAVSDAVEQGNSQVIVIPGRSLPASVIRIVCEELDVFSGTNRDYLGSMEVSASVGWHSTPSTSSERREAFRGTSS